MTTTEVWFGDYGYDLTINTGFDLSTATTLELEIKPYHGGSTKTITCTAASTTEVTAPVADGDFDRIGLWECQVKATFASAVRYGDKFRVQVVENN